MKSCVLFYLLDPGIVLGTRHLQREGAMMILAFADGWRLCRVSLTILLKLWEDIAFYLLSGDTEYQRHGQ